MQIIIDTTIDSHDDMRAAAAFLLHLVGDLNDEATALGPKEPTAPNAATVAGIASNVAPVAAIVPQPPSIAAAAIASNIPPPPPLVPTGTTADDDDEGSTSNVINFPVPPPPPSGASPAANSIASGTSVSAPSAAVVVPPVPNTAGVAVEVDRAGMPWDARIHQKSRNKKKDETWKLIKGIDPAIVQAVVMEYAATKAAAPASGTVLLPGAPGPVPVPPVPSPTAAAAVPAPPVAPSVPVPPVAAAGSVGAFRALIDKITAATKEGKITPVKVSEVCQLHGAPSLMQLNSMPHLIDDVNSSIDAVILGL